MIFALIVSPLLSQTKLVDIDGDDSYQLSSTVVLFDEFVVPSGSHYKVQDIGLRYKNGSQNGSVKFGIYDSYKALMYESSFGDVVSGADGIAMVTVPDGEVYLEGGKTYYVAAIYSGPNYLLVKTQANPVNNGIAVIDQYSQFHTHSSIYFRDIIVPGIVGSYGFGAGFVLTGNPVSSLPAPDASKLVDFNCYQSQELSSGMATAIEFITPQGSGISLKTLGIQYPAISSETTIQFAIYSSALVLLYTSPEKVLAAGTSGVANVAIPDGAFTLNANTTYRVAIKYSGTPSFNALKIGSPVNKGVATIIGYTHYAYTSDGAFPSSFVNAGSWGFSIGFLVNGRTLNATSVTNPSGSQQVEIAYNRSTALLELKNKSVGTKNISLRIHDLSGTTRYQQKVPFFDRQTLDLSFLPSGIYLVNLNWGTGSRVLKIVR